jgi:hypothetical protein
METPLTRERLIPDQLQDQLLPTWTLCAGPEGPYTLRDGRVLWSWGFQQTSSEPVRPYSSVVPPTLASAELAHGYRGARASSQR